MTSKTFVLVHGAWHGAWNWRHVLAGLRALGHTATAPTLTGLGERQHLGGDAVDLDTHINDIVAHIEMEDLREVTLVGASYGGMVITGVLARITDRIVKLVYLDAFVPMDGQTMVDCLSDDRRGYFEQAKGENKPVPPIPAIALGVDDAALLSFIEPRASPQSWRTFFRPVKALKARPEIPVTYILCKGYNGGPSVVAARYEEIKRAEPSARIVSVPMKHLCMMTHPEDTVALLVDA